MCEEEKNQGKARRDYRKEFESLMRRLSGNGRMSIRELWPIAIQAIACFISAASSSEVRERRLQEFRICTERIGGEADDAQTCIIELLTLIADAYEENPEQDFLGEIYMRLGLGDKRRGQCFTPYHVCSLMSRVISPDGLKVVNPGDLKARIEEKRWISVLDSAAGSGAMLIAHANMARKEGVNYQQRILYACQDSDRTAGLMAYIQLSVLGCAGYVFIGNTLTDPIKGEPLNPIEGDNQDFWYTPMYFSWLWTLRRNATV